MTSLKKILKSKKFIAIPLVLTETNHFEISAKINGIAGRFILDTGASNTCVGLDKADLFQLISKSSEIKAAGAGASEMETFVADDNKLEIGNWKFKKQQIVLFDLTHVNDALVAHHALPVDGIIGSDVLKKAKAVIDYRKKKVYLKRK